MKTKIIVPSRLRRIPAQFSWVDHRLMSQRMLCGCSSHAWALYLFLVTVGDADGISYYSQGSLCAHVGLAAAQLIRAREELMVAGVMAWEAPYYQVLALREPARVWAIATSGGHAPDSVGNLDDALKGGPR